MLPTMAGAANRCVIPEHKFNIEHLTELLRWPTAAKIPAATPSSSSPKAHVRRRRMVFEGSHRRYGHKKLAASAKSSREN